jgi:hypothetical protein
VRPQTSIERKDKKRFAPESMKKYERGTDLLDLRPVLELLVVLAIRHLEELWVSDDSCA